MLLTALLTGRHNPMYGPSYFTKMVELNAIAWRISRISEFVDRVEEVRY